MTAPIDAVTWVAAFDGGKALIWRNEGFDDQPNLKLLESFGVENLPDRDLSDDRPGRMADPAGGLSGVEQTDRHDQVETRFIETFIHRLNASAAGADFDRILVFAPPAALGTARGHYTDALKVKLTEIPLDVVNEPMEKIDARVAEALTG